jgi:hypothetical protein
MATAPLVVLPLYDGQCLRPLRRRTDGPWVYPHPTRSCTDTDPELQQTQLREFAHIAALAHGSGAQESLVPCH